MTTAVCTGCGRLRPVAARTADGPWCGSCRPVPVVPCFLCGQTRRCEISQATGKPWCKACRRYWARCAGCGAFESIYAGTRAAPLCARCCNRDPGFWNRCPVCEQTWQLGTSACKRCSLSRSIADLLSGGTGRVSQGLAPLHHALTAVERPATVQNWLTRGPQVRTLLSDLGRDQRPLTHEVLDELPAGKAVAHLRSVLVAVGALPARDERLLKLEQWIAGLLQARGDLQEHRILHGYAIWHLLRRLRQRLGSPGRPDGIAGHTSPREYNNVRLHVLAAVNLMDLLHDHGLTLATFTQAHLDTWMASGCFTYPKETRHFIRWAVARKHAHGLAVPEERHRTTARVPHDAEQRWDDARRLLHDESLPLHDRVAGLLVLLYAQALPDIASLTTEHVRDDGTEVKITLGAVPVALPGPMATLVRELAATRPGHATIGCSNMGPWLFPGGRPGHPLDAKRIGERLKSIGLHPRHDRATALFTLAAELPAAILARTLGISIPIAAEWQRASAGDWINYAAEVSRRAVTEP